MGFVVFIQKQVLLEFVDMVLVLLFEYVRILTALFSRLRVHPVFGNLINEKQSENFNTLMKEPLFFVKMSPDGLAYLNASQGHFIHITCGLASLQFNAIFKGHRI